jgi:hypothetical protein
MRTHGDGPIIGLNEGWISMGDFVSTAVEVSINPYKMAAYIPFFTISAINTEI